MKTIFEKSSKMELVEVTEPKDFTEMYRHCPSCMQVTSKHRNKYPIAYTLLHNHGLWLSSFYAFVPGVKGILFKIDGKVVGRTIIQNNVAISPGYCVECGQFDFNDAYGEPCNKGYHDTFETVLKAAKIRIDNREMVFPKILRIPGVKQKNNYYLPVPCIDTLQSCLLVKFNNKTKVFIVKNNNYTDANGYSYIDNSSGWISDKDVKNY